MPPDILLLSSQWPLRALLRAQLKDEGYEIVAASDWPTAKSQLELLLKPRLLIVDLQGLGDTRKVLEELRAAFPPERVLILTALGDVSVDDLQRRGFHALARPADVRDVVEKASEIIQ